MGNEAVFIFLSCQMDRVNGKKFMLECDTVSEETMHVAWVCGEGFAGERGDSISDGPRIVRHLVLLTSSMDSLAIPPKVIVNGGGIAAGLNILLSFTLSRRHRKTTDVVGVVCCVAQNELRGLISSLWVQHFPGVVSAARECESSKDSERRCNVCSGRYALDVDQP